MMEEASKLRETLLEKIVETNDELMLRYLEGEEIRRRSTSAGPSQSDSDLRSCAGAVWKLAAEQGRSAHAGLR